MPTAALEKREATSLKCVAFEACKNQKPRSAWASNQCAFWEHQDCTNGAASMQRTKDFGKRPILTNGHLRST